MSGIPMLVVLSVMVVLINLLMRSSIVASCTEVSMGISTGALVVMVGAVGAGVAGVTGGVEVASEPETASFSLDWTVNTWCRKRKVLYSLVTVLFYVEFGNCLNFRLSAIKLLILWIAFRY